MNKAKESIAESIPQVSLTFLKFQIIKCEISILFMYFLSFLFFSVMHKTELYNVCEYYTYQTIALLVEIFLFMFVSVHKL